MLKFKLAFLFAYLLVALSLNAGDANQNSFSFARALRSKFNKALNSENSGSKVSGHHGILNEPIVKKLSAPLNKNLQRKQTAQLAQSQALNNHMRGPHPNNIMQDNQNQGSWLLSLAQQKHRSKLNDGLNLMNGLGSYHPPGLTLNGHHIEHHPPPMKQFKEFQKAVKSGDVTNPHINMEEVQQADYILKLNAQKAQLDAFAERKRTNGHYLNQFRNNESNMKSKTSEPTESTKSNLATKDKIFSRKLSIYKTLQEKEKNSAKAKQDKESLKVLSGVNGTSRNYDLFKELDLLDEFDNLKEEDMEHAENKMNNQDNGDSDKSLKLAASAATSSSSASTMSDASEMPPISKEEYLESLKMFATRHRNPEHVFNEYRKFLAESR